MKIETTYLHVDDDQEKTYRLGAEVTDVDDTIFDATDPEKLPGAIFRFCQKEYGRCVSGVYVGEGDQVGWVFEKRMQYEDCNDTYIRQVWVTLLDRDEIIRDREYHVIGRG